MTQANLQDTLRSAYSRQAFIDRILLPAFQHSTKDFQLFAEGMEIPIDLTETERGIAKSIVQYGGFVTHDDREVTLYEVTVAEGRQVDRTRMGFWALLKKHLLGSGAALAVFKHENPERQTWRLSLIASDTWLVDGQVETSFTQPKRFTYLLGKDQKVKTAAERLNALAGKPEMTLDDLLDAFSVAPLSKAFFDEYRDTHYRRFVQYLTKSNFKAAVFNGNEKAIRDFVKKLLGRIVFLYFLQKKGWLGATSDQYQDGDPDFMSHFFAQSGKDETFYATCLSRLFFDTLNKKRANDDFTMPDGATVKIPYLNGGLFEKESEKYDLLTFPPELFSDFFAFFDEYNFTVDEDSPHEHTIAVDPEMLGHIFENLLEDNKDKGTYYTPKEIVHYMTQAALVAYLHTRLPHLPHDALERFVKDQEGLLPREDRLPLADQKQIETRLDSIKICDPAIGSGAFPMGVLQRIVMALEQLDPECRWWIKRQIDRIENPLLRKQVREKLSGASVAYARKIGIIQHSLFGVDIQPIAAEISKLRCFLTLIVDEHIDEGKPNRGIEPLPNLEFKFIAADTISKLPEENKKGMQSDMFSGSEGVKALHALRQSYLQSYGEEKEEIKARFCDTQKSIIAEQLRYFENYQSRALQLSQWQPFGHAKSDWFDPLWMFGVRGFDVVLGNPPYIQMQKNGGALANLYKAQNYRTHERTGDIYALFYERGIHLLSERGHLCLITSNKWMRAKYGQSLRGFLAEQNPLCLLDLGPNVFTATVDTNILLVQKSDNRNALRALTLTDKSQLARLTERDLNPLPAPSDKAWVILSPTEQALKEKIERVGTPLKDWDVSIYRGVTTGYNEAFIIDTDKRDELVSQDPNSAEIIKPILRGRDIKRYRHEWAGKWVIFIPWHFPLHKDPAISGASEKAERAFEEQYPFIYRHLLRFKDRLAKRNKAETGIRYEWYALQRCAASYYEDFEKEKIIYPSMTMFLPFIYDDNKFYINDKNFILTGKHLKFLTGFFNSKIAHYWIRENCPKLGNEGRELRKAFFENIPIPPITPANQQEARQIESLVDKIIASKQANPHTDTTPEEQEVDELVYGLYGLSEGEVEVVEK